jgi:large subunit ribosomal protein L3
MGDTRVTTQNLKIVATDAEQGLILVQGSIPGAKQGWVLISDAVKAKMPEDLPFPAALIEDAQPAVEEAPAEAAAEAPAEAEGAGEGEAESGEDS